MDVVFFFILFIIYGSEFFFFLLHGEEDDSETEDINLEVVAFIREDLGGDIAGSSAPLKEVLAIWVVVICEAEICDADILVVGSGPHDEIFRFDISVHDSPGVEVADGLEEVVHDLSSQSFVVAFLGFQFEVEFSSLEEFTDDEDVGFVFVDLIDFEDMLVIDLSEDCDFFDQCKLFLFMILFVILFYDFIDDF